MKPRNSRCKFGQPFRLTIAILCVTSLVPGPYLVLGQGTQELATTTPAATDVPKIPNDQLDSLVAPIALYPDPLLSQTLVASTYPLEMVQLQQWMEKNKDLKDQALADAVQKQNWDPSIQAMVAFPEVVRRMAGNIQWTTEMGNAFLAQQSDVMAAVQRMRAKAQGTGSLKTSEQLKVETRVVEGGTQVIVIEQANPKVIYVPSYDPVVVYGAPAYPYPPASPGYATGVGLAFGAGLILGAAWGGDWGYHCGWDGHGGGDVNINNNNSYVNNSNNNSGNNINRGQQGGKWQHQPEHRGGAPYGDRGTADRFGGRTPGQQPAGAGNRPGGGAVNRPGSGVGAGGGAVNRPGSGVGAGGGIGSGGGAINRPGSGVGAGGGAVNRPSTLPSSRPSGAGGNGFGGRNVSPGAGYGSNQGAFGGSRDSGSAARASSARGSSSMQSKGGGGGGGGGASRGGGRGGGGGGASRGGGGGGGRR